MKKLTIYIVLALLCPFPTTKGQDIKPLKIGDTIPEAVWNIPLQVINHPDGKDSITLNDYRGKLILLDFWATWCGACVASMPTINKIEEQFNGKIIVIPISYEERVKVKTFIKTNRTISSLNMMSGYNDTVLSKFFPHSILPHVAWISPQGVFKSTSSSKYITNSNINKILNGFEPKLAVKIDIDPELPLFLSDAIPNDSLIKQYCIFIKGQIDGLPGGTNFRMKNKQLQGVAFFNQPLKILYNIILSNLLPKDFTTKRFIYSDNRFDSLFLSDEKLKPEDFYTYDFILKTNHVDSLWSYALNNLNLISPYRCKIEKRRIKCLALIRTSTIDKLKSQGGMKKMNMFKNGNMLNNHPISLFLTRLNQEDVSGQEIVIDETNYANNVDLNINASFSNRNSLREELRRYDLDLIPVEREIEMFCFYQNN